MTAMTRRRPLRVDRMRRYPILKGPQHRSLRWDQWSDPAHVERLIHRIGSAYPGQQLDVHVEQTGHDLATGRTVIRWRPRPQAPAPAWMEGGR